MTSTPASRSARATTFAPRSWPSRPGFAMTTRMLLMNVLHRNAVQPGPRGSRLPRRVAVPGREPGDRSPIWEQAGARGKIPGMELAIPVRGGEVWAEDTGDGRPLVPMHPGWGDAAIWDPILGRLAARYRVIRYDARGYGRSPA